MREFYKKEWSLSEKVLMTAFCFLLGMNLGFLFSPVKKGVYCGNHNGNTQLPHLQKVEEE